MLLPRKLQNRFNYKKALPLVLSLLFVGVIQIGMMAVKKFGYHLVYVVTPSVPRGFYLIFPQKRYLHGELVEFSPPPQALNLAKSKQWIPQSGSIIKYVFALAGDHVCIREHLIWVNGKKIGKVYQAAWQQQLPPAKVCRVLIEGQYLLLSNKNERSFDSRYFGIISSKQILGRAIPIFTY